MPKVNVLIAFYCPECKDVVIAKDWFVPTCSDAELIVYCPGGHDHEYEAQITP